MVVALVGLLSLAVGTAAGASWSAQHMVLVAMFFSLGGVHLPRPFEPPEEYLAGGAPPTPEDAPRHQRTGAPCLARKPGPGRVFFAFMECVTRRSFSMRRGSRDDGARTFRS